ncbi:MAG: hypothetical protein R3279_13270 [Putridiphycobacter sp.]|nr:hypothetical protein [Putridiphycobacter sp.]
MHHCNKFILFLSAILLFGTAVAQKGTQSPYSVYGLGELRSGKYAYFNALGGTQIANTDSTIITQSNPASYAGIERNRPIFQVGLNGTFSNLVTDNSSAQTRQFGLDQFQLGLPIGKRFGAALGLTPFSSTGYLISNPIFEGTDTVAQKINEGKGTLSNFHVGIGYKQKFGKSSSFSIGANLNYVFGESERIESYEYTSYPDDALHSRVKTSTYLSDFKFDFGAIYEQKLYRSSFSLAATVSPAANMSGSSQLVAFAYSQSFYQNYSYSGAISDTAKFLTDITGEAKIPLAFKIGGEYRIMPCPGSNLSYLLILKGEYNQQNWKDYQTSFGNSANDTSMLNRTHYKFGLEYTPRAGAKANDNLAPYLSKLHYRMGINYMLSELNIQNTQIQNYGISFGLGIPVLNGNSNTNLNLGVTYNAFGTTENNLILEQNLGLSFGISISPGVYDRWFMKRKYD